MYEVKSTWLIDLFYIKLVLSHYSLHQCHVAAWPFVILRVVGSERLQPMATVDAQQVDETLVFYEDEENLKKLCNFLRSNEGVPVREAIEMDKRVYYLKGQ